MDRDVWNETLSEKDCPAWPCPSCNSGKLHLVPRSLVKEETISSLRSHRDPNFEPEWVKYSFVAWAQCSSQKCKQKCAISGVGSVAPAYTSEDGDWEYFDHFKPLGCHPMPDMISLPETCPENVAEELRAAFCVYWINSSACAGRIRVALELLMDHLGVPKRKRRKDGGGMAVLTLHSRIDIFASKQPAFGKHLMALKWIGNSGSHDGVVGKADLIDAFELLEHTLDELVEKRSARFANLAKKLLRRHGH